MMQNELFPIDRTGISPALMIGCAGWGLSSANMHLFPDTGTHLQRYAALFPCVEINTSFYRLHRAETYARWRDSVPDTFRFSVKLLRTITHFKRLENCEADLAQFLDTVCALERKWGCLLVQFPPSFSYPGASAREFFSLLRERVAVDIVCEPRHQSWFEDEVLEWMTRAGIAYVEADPPAVTCQRQMSHHLSTQYIRLHGSPRIYHSSYSENYLDQLAIRLSNYCASGRRAWCIFDNTASGAAIDNAFSLESKTKNVSAA